MGVESKYKCKYMYKVKFSKIPVSPIDVGMNINGNAESIGPPSGNQASCE